VFSIPIEAVFIKSGSICMNGHLMVSSKKATTGSEPVEKIKQYKPVIMMRV